MPSPHDPDHARGASVLLPDEMEEKERPSPGSNVLKGSDSRAATRFWLGLVTLLVALAVLAIGLIFFSDWPGALAGEVLGAGLVLLATCALVISGAWLPARPLPRKASSPDASPDLPTAPAPPATPPNPEIHPVPAARNEPLTATAPAAPAGEETGQEEASAAEPSAKAPPSSRGEAAPPPGKRATRAGAARPRPSPPAGAEAAGTRQRPDKASSGVTEPRLPALVNLPAGLPPFVDRNLIDADANDLGELLGDIAEQTVLAMLTRGQRGTQRRERMAAKIERFRKEMALDPDYAAVSNFLESITGLLRAGAIVPASRALVDPFDGLYDYVLTLIRRKSGTQHD